MHNTLAGKAAGGKKVFMIVGIAADDHVSVEHILGIMPAPAALQFNCFELRHHIGNQRPYGVFEVIGKISPVDILDITRLDFPAWTAADKSFALWPHNNAAFVLD